MRVAGTRKAKRKTINGHPQWLKEFLVQYVTGKGGHPVARRHSSSGSRRSRHRPVLLRRRLPSSARLTGTRSGPGQCCAGTGRGTSQHLSNIFPGRPGACDGGHKMAFLLAGKFGQQAAGRSEKPAALPSSSNLPPIPHRHRLVVGPATPRDLRNQRDADDGQA